MAAALATAIALIPVAANSGKYTTDPKGHPVPRWSNDRHHEDGLIVGHDCVALPPHAGADYIPGRDAWGRTIIPAEQPKNFDNSLPMDVELDILLKQKNIGGKNIDLTADAVPFNNRSWQPRDCHPSQK